MQIRYLFGKFLLSICFLSMLLAISGCEGKESREKVDTTVEELAGKKDLERYKQMKEDLEEIQTRQSERMQQLNSDGENQ